MVRHGTIPADALASGHGAGEGGVVGGMGVMLKRVLLCLTIAFLGLSLAGCSLLRSSSVSDPSEFEGQWFNGPTGARLELREDGTLNAYNWPAGIGCSSGAPTNEAEAITDVRVDFSGEWDPPDPGSLAQRNLIFSSDACAESGTFVWLARSLNGQVLLCARYDSSISLEESQDSDIFVMAQDGVAGGSGRDCI